MLNVLWLKSIYDYYVQPIQQLFVNQILVCLFQYVGQTCKGRGRKRFFFIA